jgi:uncharacterized repeat protein (TIGR02543 family)
MAKKERRDVLYTKSIIRRRLIGIALSIALVFSAFTGLPFGDGDGFGHISYADVGDTETSADGIEYQIRTGGSAYDGDGAYVIGYSGSSKSVAVPETLDSQPVVSVELVDLGLTSLDVSACKSLKTLYCSDNRIGNLDLSGLGNLKSLACGNNNLTALILTGCTSLDNIDCDKNRLTAIDATPCTSLSTLSCSENMIDTLDVGRLTSLMTLFCPGNKLTGIDISSLTGLDTLVCFNNSIPSGPALTALIERFGVSNTLPQADVPIVYTVTLDADGGAVTPATVVRKDTNEAEGTFGALPVPSRPGYTFGGWWTGGTPAMKISEKTTVYNVWTESQTDDFSVKIYARWTLNPPNKYQVTFDANGGSPVPGVSVAYNAAIGVLPATSREHHMFLGWYTERIGGSMISEATTVTGDMTVYAHWEINKCGVAFNSNGGSPVPGVSVAYNSSIGVLPTTSRKYHVFLGWYTSSAGGGRVTAATVVTSDMTVYAHWKLDSKAFSAPSALVNAPANKDVVKFTAPSKKTVKRNKSVSIKLTNFKNVTVKSISIDKKGKKLIKAKKGRNKITLKSRGKKGTTKIRVTLKNGNRKTITIRIK